MHFPFCEFFRVIEEIFVTVAGNPVNDQWSTFISILYGESTLQRDIRGSGSGFSPYSGPYGAIETKSFLGDASPQSMPSSTTRGDLSSHGIGVAQASRPMYPFNLTLSIRHITL